MANGKKERFLGLDYGEKRIGTAFGDDLGLAVPLDPAVGRTKESRLEHIGKLIAERGITEIVVGYPYNMDGSVGFKAREVDRFAELLGERFGLPVRMVDERLTTFEVERRLRAGKKVPSRRSGEVDSLAATLILQDFLDQRYPA